MFSCIVNEETSLRLIDRQHSEELFALLDSNRAYLQRWHPWVEIIRSVGDLEKFITGWLQQYANNRGFFTGIWFNGKCCGMVNHVNIDWSNRSTTLSYFLDAAHQGKGIMTESCRAMLAHSFNIWKLNRITIECATQNTRSRAIPARLGFKLEGVVRGIEWLNDRYVDHAMYGLLRADWIALDPAIINQCARAEQSLVGCAPAVVDCLNQALLGKPSAVTQSKIGIESSNPKSVPGSTPKKEAELTVAGR